jgi:hypothetical protein
VIWEDRDRPVQDLYFETTADFVDDLDCNPHAFLVGSVMTALRFGEKRLAIDAEVCPQLLEGLFTAMSWIRHWEGQNLPIVEIEAKTQRGTPRKLSPERAGVCYSGGIDSLATLRNNRLKYPARHPLSFKDGLMIHGIANTTLESYEKAFRTLSIVAEDAKVTLIPVNTNLYQYVKDLEDSEYTFFRFYLASSALSAVGHAFHNRLTSLSMSASEEICHMKELSLWGTHPLLDCNYSSYDLQINHADIALSRLNKTQLIAGWDVALQNLRVCDELNLPSGYLNCGACPKCMITMTTLLALGVLNKTNVFPFQDLSATRVGERANPNFSDDVNQYLCLVPLLEAQGRNDIARSIRCIAANFRWRKFIKEFDRQHLKGTILHLYQGMRQRKA